MKKSSIYFLYFVNPLRMVMVLIVLPSISGMCGKPSPTENSKPKDANLEAYPANSEVFYECDKGYVYKRGSGKSVCQIIGRTYSWTYPELTCLPIQCPAPQQPVNGRIVNTEYTYGKTIQFECNIGHIMYSSNKTIRLEESPKRTCQADETWDGDTPVCVPVECPNPETVSHSDLKVTDILYGGKLIYICNEGYYLHSGDLERQCLPNGTWSGELPQCEEIKCEDPFSDEFKMTHDFLKTIIIEKNYVYEVLFECTNQVNSFKSMCKENGNWEPAPPSCEVIETQETAAVYNGETGIILTGNNMNSTTDTFSSNTSGLPIWAMIIIVIALVAILSTAVATFLYKRRKSQKSTYR